MRVVLLNWLFLFIHGQNICQDATFTATQNIRLGDSPLMLNFVKGETKVCIQITLTDASATWLSIGIARGENMVSAPVANAIVYGTTVDPPQLFSIASKSQSDIVVDPNQEAIDVFQASRTASGMEVIFERAFASESATSAEISLSDTSNVIWAYGSDTWPITFHAPGTRGTTQINFATGASVEVDLFITTNTLYISLGLVVGMMLCGLIATKGCGKSRIGHALLHFRLHKPIKTSAFHSLTLDFFPQLLDLKYGELLIILIYFFGIIGIMWDTSSKYDDAGQDSKTRWSIVTGHITAASLMFILYPVSKVPVWSWSFGISEDRLIKFHRWNARIMINIVPAHLLLAKDTCGLLEAEKCGNQEVIPQYGFFAFISFASMGIFTIEPIRRNFYEIFYFHHRVASVAGIIFTILHSSLATYAVIFPLVLYLFGVLIRFKGYFNRTSINVATCTHNVSFIELASTNKTVKWAKAMEPGSFFWVCIPKVSAIEWHPFSAITSPDGNTIGFAIKDQGGSSFTARTLNVMRQQITGMEAYLDGPYGKLSITPRNYRTLVFVAGGIGITPMLSMYNQSYFSGQYRGVERIVLIWTVQGQKDLLAVENFMFSSQASADATNPYAPLNTPSREANSTNNSLIKREQHFYVSKAATDGFIKSNTKQTVNYRCGRPQFGEIFGQLPTAPTAVLACGPQPLVDLTQSIASEFRFDFHKEIFKW